jgi:ferric-dicitrate binding protein FerR (iron transport regulator)
MPPEQENLNRQLEALQRYVSDLQQQRERAKAAAAQPPPAPEPEPRRPPRRWLLLTGLLVTLALVGGIFVGAVAWSDDRPAGAEAGSDASSATQSATPPASPRSPPRPARRR